LAVVYAIYKFRHYVTSYPNFIHIDHTTVKYLMNKPITNSKVTRWLLLLQEFDITIADRPGKENVVADFLSRLHVNDDNSPIDDSFLDENLFVVSAHSPWYVDIANYLVTWKVLAHNHVWGIFLKEASLWAKREILKTHLFQSFKGMTRYFNEQADLDSHDLPA
jgi:adenosine deaminase